METNKWFIFNIIFVITATFCLGKDQILWDMGMVIKEPVKAAAVEAAGLQNNISRINAVRTDPFVPPIRVSQNSFQLKKFNYNYKKVVQVSAVNKKEVFSDLAACIINKNNLAVIKILEGADINNLSASDRSDLEYRLANAFYSAGELSKALEYTKSSIIKFEEDRFYLLLGLVYEAQGKMKKAKHTYQKIIRNFPDGEYFLTAKIKSRVLTHN